MSKRNDYDKVSNYFEYGIDVETRRLFLNKEIMADGTTIVPSLLLLESLDPHKDIELYISCPGGDDYTMYEIHDAIKLVSCDVSTISMGKCMSAAPLIAAAGTKGKRFAYPNTYFMIHDGNTDGLDNANNHYIKAEIEHLMESTERWARLMHESTGKSQRFWHDLCKKTDNTYFDVKDAIKYGIIDAISTGVCE